MPSFLQFLSHCNARKQMPAPIDLWTIAKTNDLIGEVTDACEKYEFHRAIQSLNRFCSGILSSTYHDVIKDRLYTLDPNDPLRRSTQSALTKVFETLIKLIGPFTPYIADEAWAFGQSGEEYCKDSLSLQDWPTSQSKATSCGAATLACPKTTTATHHPSSCGSIC